jgi:putative PIN family toxin of toxin-antitoxin system
MKAVIDTNIFLPGLLNAEGGAAKIIRAFRNGEFKLVITREVFVEYVRVLHLFDNTIPAFRSEALLELVFEKASKVRPSPTRGWCPDPGDEKFVAAALGGGAATLVTKNRKHFPRDHPSLKIVTVRGFLELLEKNKK